MSTLLELIAAKARVLADDVKAGRHWPCDLSAGLAELAMLIARAQQEDQQ